ncbi:sterol esterase [Saccharomycopsis crataegensis]|uniref:Sterol esterase n=1 Tax=Saccharomycopsis crataegensis TaxID=43959 RepID=A0AAV5QUL8_9ASCO|nr:sterol esterase [Saccharomycopsis crataegensis]
MYIPLFHRVDRSEWPMLLASLVLIYIETLITFITALLPQKVLRLCDHVFAIVYSQNPVQSFYNLKSFTGVHHSDVEFLNQVKNAQDFQSLCLLHGYDAQNHTVKTKDGYILTLHRIVGDDDREFGSRPVVYLHHGLLMNSEIWVTMINSDHNLPFVLYQLGYDVWLGNNRGNKYSKKHMWLKPKETKFWDFSIDEFAIHDIPTAIDYILDCTDQPDLTYIGFSQGTAQGFASLSIHRELNSKINGMVALSPAMTPKGLHHPVVDTLMKASPILMFLFFGRRVLLSSATFWSSVIYPPLFIKVIDYCNILLFNWYGNNINFDQKVLSYSHLYSSTSVKTVVHWFQIIRNRSFQMYDDAIGWNIKPRRSAATKRHNDYVVPTYPTRNIEVPIWLVYGKADSLVDIEVMLEQLPASENIKAFGVEGYEHLEIIWGDGVEQLVFPHVLEFLKTFKGSSQ